MEGSHVRLPFVDSNKANRSEPAAEKIEIPGWLHRDKEQGSCQPEISSQLAGINVSVRLQQSVATADCRAVYRLLSK
jgi:hypothetical protein